MRVIALMSVRENLSCKQIGTHVRRRFLSVVDLYFQHADIVASFKLPLFQLIVLLQESLLSLSIRWAFWLQNFNLDLATIVINLVDL